MCVELCTLVVTAADAGAQRWHSQPGWHVGPYLNLSDVPTLEEKHEQTADANAATHAQRQRAIHDGRMECQAEALRHAAVCELCLHRRAVHPYAHRRQLMAVPSGRVLNNDVTVQRPLQVAQRSCPSIAASTLGHRNRTA